MKGSGGRFFDDVEDGVAFWKPGAGRRRSHGRRQRGGVEFLVCRGRGRTAGNWMELGELKGGWLYDAALSLLREIGGGPIASSDARVAEGLRGYQWLRGWRGAC